jgi:hypothetical protein
VASQEGLSSVSECVSVLIIILTRSWLEFSV